MSMTQRQDTRRSALVALFALALLAMPWSAIAAPQPEVRIKELARLASVQDNALVGYGVVTGLAGTGDTSRSMATMQSIANVLQRFGLNVDANQMRSRNAAGVMVTATLPAFARSGDKLDINVTSLGDARSLLGGTLLLTHLNGPDGRVYALAQGPLSVGGFKYDLNGNVVQKNHPTAATVPEGATVETGPTTRLLSENGALEYVLFEPDFTTAARIAGALDASLGRKSASVVDAGRVRVDAQSIAGIDLIAFLTRVESLTITPDRRAVVVVNERTGTVVSGGDVLLSDVTISHGSLRVSITTDFLASQPTLVARTGPGVRTVVVPDTTVEVTEDPTSTVGLEGGSTVADLVQALNQIGATPRDLIQILQSVKRAGALHAELVIQ